MADRNINNLQRYYAAAYAVQSAVAYEIGLDERNGTSCSATTPKQLRAGINMAMAEHSAIAKLLISKGIITDHEYTKAIADAAETECARYEEKYPWIKFH